MSMMLIWSDVDAIERHKRVAWSVASEAARKTGGDPVLMYQRLMKRFQDKETNKYLSHDKSRDSK